MGLVGATAKDAYSIRKISFDTWIKMKYLKRKFLPPDYRDLMFQEFLNRKELGNSVAGYTKEFYRPAIIY